MDFGESMPKRGDNVLLDAVCEGAMEGLNSGAKYFVKVGDNKIQVTPNDILSMDDLICLVSSHLGCYQPADPDAVKGLLVDTLEWIYEQDESAYELFAHEGKIHVIFDRDKEEVDE